MLTYSCSKTRSLQTHRPSNEGSALLISLFVILAMSGLGIVAMQSSATGLLTSRTQLQQSASRVAADAGAAMAVSFLNDRGFASVVAWQLRQPAASGERRRVVYNAHRDGLPNAVGVAGEARFASDAVFGIPREGRTAQSFRLTMTRQWPPVNVGGSEVGLFCRERIRVDGTGFAWAAVAEPEEEGEDGDPEPDPEEPPTDPTVEIQREPPPNANMTRFMLYALTPPVLCDDI